MRHHGEALRALTKDDGLVAALERDPFAAVSDPRSRALVGLAVTLTESPDQAAQPDIESLRFAGLSDSAIHDAVAVIAYFNFVNRIALGLGVDLEDEYLCQQDSPS